MTVKIGFFLALVAVTLCLLATSAQAAAAPPAQTPARLWDSDNQLVEEAGSVVNVPEELESARVRRSPKVCRHVIVHNKKNGKNYPHWECN